MNILVVGSALGLPTTIVRFLGREERQRRLMRQTMLVTARLPASPPRRWRSYPDTWAFRSMTLRYAQRC